MRKTVKKLVKTSKNRPEMLESEENLDQPQRIEIDQPFAALPAQGSVRAYPVTREIPERGDPVEFRLEPAGQEQAQHVKVADQ